MTAPKTFLHTWEKHNEELLILYFEHTFYFTKLISKKVFRVLNILAFIIYKSILITGLLLRTAFLSTPKVYIPSEEAWLYRQVR